MQWCTHTELHEQRKKNSWYSPYHVRAWTWKCKHFCFDFEVNAVTWLAERNSALRNLARILKLKNTRYSIADSWELNILGGGYRVLRKSTTMKFVDSSCDYLMIYLMHVDCDESYINVTWIEFQSFNSVSNNNLYYKYKEWCKKVNFIRASA